MTDRNCGDRRPLVERPHGTWPACSGENTVAALLGTFPTSQACSDIR
jgi:hypothetical protein